MSCAIRHAKHGSYSIFGTITVRIIAPIIQGLGCGAGCSIPFPKKARWVILRPKLLPLDRERGLGAQQVEHIAMCGINARSNECDTARSVHAWTVEQRQCDIRRFSLFVFRLQRSNKGFPVLLTFLDRPSFQYYQTGRCLPEGCVRPPGVSANLRLTGCK